MITGLAIGAHIHLPNGTVAGRVINYNWVLIRTTLSISPATATDQRISLKAEEDKHQCPEDVHDLVHRMMDHEAAKASRPGWCYQACNTVLISGAQMAYISGICAVVVAGLGTGLSDQLHDQQKARFESPWHHSSSQSGTGI